MAPKTEKDRTPAPNHVEDVTDALIDSAKVLDDDELAAGGVVPVQAYMRTRTSRNALRQRKAKARAQAGADGRVPRRQINLQAPTDDASREALKKLAAAMVDGEVIASDLDTLGRLDTMRLGQDAQRTLNAGGWRAALLRRLLGKTK